MEKITGQLKDDILNGKAVLFLGAGVSQAAGLFGGNKLSNYLFDKAGSPEEYLKYKDDLSKLVAKIDKNPSFTRRWIDNQLKEYFLNIKSYTDLSYHKKIFQLHWKAIFTTNYDSSLEFAENYTPQKLYRLLPIVNPKDNALLNDADTGKLKYYKIHGCCRELEQHPTDAPQLVITQKNFLDSISRNQPFLEALRGYAYDCSIIFIGFQANRVENNPILASVQEACKSIATSFHQTFRPFAVLKGVDEDTKSDLEDIDVIPIEGTFEEFIDTVILLKGEQKKRFGSATIEDKIYIKVAGKEIELTRAEYKQYASQFICNYEGYFEEEANKLKELQQAKIVDLWKTYPSDMLLASGRYITRTIFNEAVTQLKDIIKNTANTKSPQLLIIEGDRASGKTVLAKQLTHFAYSELNQPALILTPQASYLDKPHGSAKEINVSGWDGRLIDKFLSLFYEDGSGNSNNVVPILLADHLSYRQFALDHLLKYLENHGKPCVLILTLNTDELLVDDKDRRLLQLYKNQYISIRHELDDDEIEMLFDKISYDNQRILDMRDTLLDRAKDPYECDRDILFIFYVWFDRQFRRLDEIITEEIEKLSSEPDLKNLYLAIAVFHQYKFSPRISLCAEALDIDIANFSELRKKPTFKAFVNLSADLEAGNVELASTRHSEFSRKILSRLMPEPEKQIELIEKILKHTGQVDVQFIRDFLNYIYRYGASFTVEQVTKLKTATEKKLSKDYVLNHQFSAYLIREKVRLDDARYYLDIALNEDQDNAAIIHSIGNLCFILYKNKLEEGQISKASEYFSSAKDYFFKSRALMNTPDEHAYFTDIDMTNYRIINDSAMDVKTKTLLNAEKQALTLEALRVIPVERQNLLRKIVGEGVLFRELPENEKEIIVSEIMAGKASPILLEYYSESLLSNPKGKNWNKLKEIVSLYWKTDCDAATATVAGLISKRAFIKTATNRFEFLRVFYDKLVRYRETKMNFALLAEYIRLLLVDALVLEKYDFLRAVTGEIRDLFRDSLPRFLRDEFILDKNYYIFDENDKSLLVNLFENNASDFYSHKKAKRFSNLVNLSSPGQERYFRIELDPITQYFIRGIRKEVGTHSGRIELNFCIKHTHEVFIATDFRV